MYQKVIHTLVLRHAKFLQVQQIILWDLSFLWMMGYKYSRSVLAYVSILISVNF